MAVITYQQVRELFDYVDGYLLYKSGKRAGYIKDTGYWRTTVDGKVHLNHRLIFLWYHGYLPEYVDHIDGNTLNNLIGNLRKCSLAENNRNRRSANGSTSRFKGVHLNKSKNRWIAQIRYNGEKIYLGSFKQEIDAAKAYDNKALELHGGFSRLNLEKAC